MHKADRAQIDYTRYALSLLLDHKVVVEYEPRTATRSPNRSKHSLLGAFSTFRKNSTDFNTNQSDSANTFVFPALGGCPFSIVYPPEIRIWAPEVAFQGGRR